LVFKVVNRIALEPGLSRSADGGALRPRIPRFRTELGRFLKAQSSPMGSKLLNRGECGSKRLLRPGLIERADVLADVAAKGPFAEARLEARVDLPSMLDREIANASASVQLPSAFFEDEGSGGASVNASSARAASAHRRAIRLKASRRQQDRNEEEAPAMAIG